jgi:hypothetical protein
MSLRVGHAELGSVIRTPHNSGLAKLSGRADRNMLYVTDRHPNQVMRDIVPPPIALLTIWSGMWPWQMQWQYAWSDLRNAFRSS